MSNLSIRLPRELDEQLTAEAKQSHMKRSALIREAISDYLRRRERDRFMAEIVKAAHMLANDPEARSEARAIEEEFSGADSEVLDEVKEGKGQWWV